MAANALDAIMLLGDSLTQGGWDRGGFAQRLAYVYARKLDVVNRGFSGYNTEWAIPVFKECFAKKTEKVPKVKLLTIWFGANDACLEQSPQYVPLERFTANLKEVIGLVRSPDSDYHSPGTRIILITAPPVHEGLRAAELASHDPPVENDRTHGNTRAYAEAVLQLGLSNDIPVVDMFNLIWDAAGRSQDGLKRYLHDGLHLTEAGYTLLYDNLVDCISTNFPELHYDKLPMVYPHWTEIDWKNPVPSLASRRVPDL